MRIVGSLNQLCKSQVRCSDTYGGFAWLHASVVCCSCDDIEFDKLHNQVHDGCQFVIGKCVLHPASFVFRVRKPDTKRTVLIACYILDSNSC